MKFHKVLSPFIALLFLISVLAGCDTTNANSVSGEGEVAIQFKTVSGSTTGKAVSSGNTTSSSHDLLLIEGTSGKLQVQDIRFIVAEFELDPSDADDDSTELEEFESEPFFVDLPLGEENLGLTNNQIQSGLYEELEFEVEDLDFGEKEGENEEYLALVDSIRSEFTDWPNEASMVIVGTFTATDGDTQSFKVFAKAEIEIEREFNLPLEVTEDNIQQVVSVRINPTKWVEQSDGSSQYDWDENQQLLEFEAEFENGVEEVEVDDGNFDDD
ncbi:hypothetical protein [Fodinibius saliphilus]|uniref:hypothetical protein n=1 Tax=Fodinibius saliphilus TaxID=1920650 RepID=UPI0011095CD0|nr:hypothetical protein [Fodinibius saliphilus]